MVDDIKSPRNKGGLNGSDEPKYKIDQEQSKDNDSIEATQAELEEKITQLGDDNSSDSSKASYKDGETNPEESMEDKIEEEFGPPPTIDETEQTKPKAASRLKSLGGAGFWTLKPNFTRKQWLIYGGGGLGLIIIACVLAFFALKDDSNWTPPVVDSTPVVTTVPSKLTGLQVEPEVNERQVIGVMIENSTFARPQSGLSDAGIVFEAIAEAGITRFLALYQDTGASYIGPVRSARPYFVQWCSSFDCALGHVGGSPEALRDIKKWGVKDLDEFSAAPYYHRINSRYAPHNMYTSKGQLNKLASSHGYKTSDFEGFSHLVHAPTIKKSDITTKSININYPQGSSYDVRYTYDTERNVYLRSLAGDKHFSVNEKGKKMRIAPSVVIAMVMSHSLEGDGYHSVYDSIGSGRMYMFQNGKVISGKWSRESRSSEFELTDKKGEPINLTPGQTWISAVGQSADVTYR